MKGRVFEVYAAAVCLFAVACFVVATGVFAYALIGVASPAFTLNSHDFSRHQSNDAFWALRPPVYPMGAPEASAAARPPEAELTAQREASYARAVAGERRESLQTAVKTFIVILIDLAVFLFHWRYGRREAARAS